MDYKKAVESKNYDFLHNNEDLKQIIYLVASGSHGYGTSNENSDLDLRGVLIETDKYLYGVNSYEQFENIDTDTVIYGFKKFISLCIKANPNALELLGVDDNEIVICDERGSILREKRELFLTKRVIKSFGNYALAQLKRLQNALARDTYPQEEKEAHILNTLNSQMNHFSNGYSKFGQNGIKLYIDNSNKSEMDKEIYCDILLKNYPLRDFVNINSELTNIIRTYSKLNHRNNKKSEDKLYKHAMHLIRLLITGIDILNGEGISTKRKNEQDMLLKIRDGKINFEEIFKIIDEYQKKFYDVSKNTKLPDEVDIKEVEDLMIKMYKFNRK